MDHYSTGGSIQINLDGLTDQCSLLRCPVECSPEDVRRVVEEFGPVRVRLGKVSCFPATNDKPFDVLMVEVDSPDLHKLHDLIKKSLPNTQDFDEYRPHVTLAYLKPGMGKKYATDEPLGGEFTAETLCFCPKDKSGKTEVPLTGGKDDRRD